MPPNQHPNRDVLVKIIVGVVVLALAGFAYSRIQKKEETPLSTTQSETSTVSTETNTPMTNNRTYKDGTYAAMGNYSSPAGEEEVAITLDIKNNIIVSASFIGKATNPGSIKNQTLFKEGFNQYVVGKSVDSLKLQVVNGSSLTPKGFMDALVKIKAQAKA